MKKEAFVVLLSLVLLAGCGGGGSQTTPGAPFIGGTEGLVIDYFAGAPPAEVTDNSQYPFAVTLKLTNKGEADVDAGNVWLSLSGISPEDFGGEYQKNSPEPLKGTFKDQEGNKIEGTTTSVSFDNFNYNKALVGNTPFTIRTEICYQYYTKAQAMLCIKKDVNKVSDNSICKISEPKAVANSGSPVQIDNLREAPGGANKISFSFTITHKAQSATSGMVYSPTAAACEDSFTTRNKVHIQVDTGIGSGPTCSGLQGNSGDILLSEGSRAIICSQDVSSATTTYVKPITITATFNYLQHKDAQILVKHASG